MNFELFNAILSMDAYNRGYEAGIILSSNSLGSVVIAQTTLNGITTNLDSGVIVDPVTDERLDDDIGFYALAYDISSSSYSSYGDKIISFRGTDDFDSATDYFTSLDVGHGWLLGVGNYRVDQALMALEFTNQVAGDPADIRNSNLFVTGHSLGGGLASYVGALTHQDAVVFDSMGYVNAANSAYFYASTVPETDPQYNDLAKPIIDQVYKLNTPWNVDTNTTTAFHIKDESLHNDFTRQAPSQELDLGASVDLSGTTFPFIGDESIARHSISTLVIRQFAEVPEFVDDLSTANIHEALDWRVSAKYFWPILYDDGFASGIGFANTSDTSIAGELRDDNKFADILRTTIAYSAIDEGTMPFGNTAIRSLYNDANDLGAALQIQSNDLDTVQGIMLSHAEKQIIFSAYDSVFHGVSFGNGGNVQYVVEPTLTNLAEEITEAYLTYAGSLALNKITEDLTSPDFINGVLDFSNNELVLDSDNVNIDLAGISSDLFYDLKYSIYETIHPYVQLNSSAAGWLYNSAQIINPNAFSLSWNNLYDYLATNTEEVVLTTANQSTYTLNDVTFAGKHNLLFNGGFHGMTVNGSNSSDFVIGSASDDIILGGDGDDIIHGYLGDDTLNGGQGDDLISGHHGFDILDYSQDYLAGGTGVITIDLSDVVHHTATDGWGDTDKIYEIDHFILSQNNDSVYGNNSLQYKIGDIITKNRIFDGGDGFDTAYNVTGHAFRFYEDVFYIQNPAIEFEFRNFESIDNSSSGTSLYNTLLLDENTELAEVSSILPNSSFRTYDFSQSSESVTFDFERYISGSLNNIMNGSEPIEKFNATMGDLYLELDDLTDVDTIVGSNNGDTYYYDSARLNGEHFDIIMGSGDDTLQVSPFLGHDGNIENIYYTGGHDNLFVAGHDPNIILTNQFATIDPNVFFTLGSNYLGLVTLEFDSNNSLTFEIIPGYDFSVGRTDIYTYGSNFENNSFHITDPVGNYNTDLEGGWGDDVLIGYSNNDETFFGYDGDDYIEGGEGNDVLSGMFGNDTLYGGLGDDNIVGGYGDDIIYGNEGDDNLVGAEGDDIYYWNLGDGDDIIYDYGGYDRLVLNIPYATPVVVPQTNLDFKMTMGVGQSITVKDQFGVTNKGIEIIEFSDGVYDVITDTFTSNGPVTLEGTSLSETITGTSVNELIYGYAGDDILYGNDGDDILYGGEGSDTYDGGNGVDTVSFEDGTSRAVLLLHTDSINQDGFGNSETITNVENVIGSDYNDIIHGNEDNNTIWGGLGNDLIYIRGGDDYIYGGDGNDSIRLTNATGVDYVFGGDGNDTFNMSTGSTAIIDGGDSAGNGDILRYNFNQVTQSIYVDVAAGEVDKNNDSIADDTFTNIEKIYGSKHDDIFIGDLNEINKLYGSNGDDLIYGGNSNDWLYGDNDSDTLYGYDGNDKLYGGNGDDILYGGAGLDTLNGGNDADTFIFEAASAYSNVDVVQDFDISESDVIDISDLLGAYDPLADALSDFVSKTEVSGHTYFAVDADGGADNFVNILRLHNVTGLSDIDTLETNGDLITS